MEKHIGFDFEDAEPDYDALGKKFFAKFYKIARKTLEGKKPTRKTWRNGY